jgi:citrate synthase
VKTRLCQSTVDDVRVRGRSVPHDLIGGVTFTEMIWWQMLGTRATPAQVAVLDGALVALMEHGLTPTAISARLTYTSAPEAMQGAVAAGLLSVGSLFIGTMEGCGALLKRIVAAADPEEEARAVAREHRAVRRPVPGFGHPQHRPDDPRSVALFALAERVGSTGAHTRAVHALSAAVDAEWGRHVTINATGAVAAILADAGIPVEILRGVALISRCAGLVGHIYEEQQSPAMDALWHGAEAAVPYIDGSEP